MDNREWFATATRGLRLLLPGLSSHMDDPGLGDWSVRSLLGHTNRAFITLESYLRAGTASPEPIALDSAAAYYRAAAGTLAHPTQVTERGHQAGVALGENPTRAVDLTASRVLALVASSDDDAPVATPLGTMSLAAYLPTRAFEVSVHSVDLARATDQEIPLELHQTVRACLSLVADIATPEQQLNILLATTGRSPLPTGLSIV